MSLAEAAAEADVLAQEGDERGLADLRKKWEDELEGSARDPDYRVRAVAYRAIGLFRYRQKIELIRRGLEDESPACRGSALLSLELLSRDHPGVVNPVRIQLHDMLTGDSNNAVRRLAIVTLKNASPQRETIALLGSVAEDDEQDKELRATAKAVAAALTKKSRTS